MAAIVQTKDHHGISLWKWGSQFLDTVEAIGINLGFYTKDIFEPNNARANLSYSHYIIM